MKEVIKKIKFSIPFQNMRISLAFLAFVLGTAFGRPQFGGYFDQTEEVDTFERLPGGGFIEDEKIFRSEMELQ
jgi:hypothetical protein